MRTIKFRVWDNVDYMSTPFSLQDLQQGKIKFTDDCIVMQFTGLHDKNGKEIYEGDVVKYIDEHIGEIQYWIGQICVGYRYKSNNVTFPLKIGNAISMEVIGNIHENPELLNQK